MFIGIRTFLVCDGETYRIGARTQRVGRDADEVELGVAYASRPVEAHCDRPLGIDGAGPVQQKEWSRIIGKPDPFLELITQADRLMKLEMRATWRVVLCNQSLNVNLIAHADETALGSINWFATRKLRQHFPALFGHLPLHGSLLGRRDINFIPSFLVRKI